MEQILLAPREACLQAGFPPQIGVPLLTISCEQGAVRSVAGGLERFAASALPGTRCQQPRERGEKGLEESEEGKNKPL